MQELSTILHFTSKLLHQLSTLPSWHGQTFILCNFILDSPPVCFFYVFMYMCVCVRMLQACMCVLISSFIHGSLHHTVSISAYKASNDRTISKRQIEKWKVFERGHCLNWRITCHLLGVTKKYDKILSEDSQCPAWDLNQAPHIHKSEALLLQPNCPIGW